MKWDIKFDLTISRGRKRIFVIERLLPFLKKLKEQHKNAYYSCFRKTRFTSHGAAMNAMWFKKHPEAPKFSAYNCEICEGWHITTEKGNGKDEE
jgi:hypothetical protein